MLFVSKSKEDRQCTYNVIFRCVRVTILSWKSNKYYILLVCICSLIYPACNEHVLYYIAISGLSGSTILFHII